VARADERRVVAAVPALVGISVAVAVLGPVLLRRGYVLSYDLVVVPDPPLASRLLGIDGSVPRAVPSDLVLALLARLMPADVAEKVLLAIIVAFAAAGATRLAARTFGCGPAPAVVAGVAYAWSPYLAERLVLGQWALLLGFAALPWAVAAAVAAGRGERGAWAATCAWTVPAAAGGGNAVALLAPVVVCVLLAGGAGSRRRRVRLSAGYLAFVAGVSLPWILPAVLRGGGLASDPGGVDAFAAGADSPLGVAGSLMTLGGVWNAGVAPPERSSLLLAVVVLGAVVAALVAGVPLLLARPGGAGLVAGGVLGLVLAALGATAGGAALVRWIVVSVPGGGLVRDGQKFLAGWVLLVAVCGGLAIGRAARLADRRAGEGLGRLAVVAAVALPVATLPSLAWGAGGRLAPAAYPAAWGAARAALAADPVPGAVVVLPWGAYRRFAWNGFRVVLDPAQRISGRPVVQADDLTLRRVRVAGEDPRAARVAAALAAPGPLPGALAALGYRYVLLHAGDSAAPGVRARLTGAVCVVRGGDLELLRLVPASAAGPATPAGTPASAPPAVVVTGLALAAAAGLAAAGGAVLSAHAPPSARRRRASPRRPPGPDSGSRIRPEP